MKAYILLTIPAVAMAIDPETSRGVFGPFPVPKGPIPVSKDSLPSGGSIRAADGSPDSGAMQSAMGKWMSDTTIVSSFLTAGRNIDDNTKFKKMARAAYVAEVDELEQKAQLDSVLLTNPAVSVANQTLENGSFQSVVDNLEIMSVQGLAQKDLIGTIDAVRCTQILPAIDTYMAAAARTIGRTAVRTAAVRPASCNEILNRVANAGVSQLSASGISPLVNPEAIASAAGAGLGTAAGVASSAAAGALVGGATSAATGALSGAANAANNALGNGRGNFPLDPQARPFGQPATVFVPNAVPVAVPNGVPIAVSNGVPVAVPNGVPVAVSNPPTGPGISGSFNLGANNDGGANPGFVAGNPNFVAGNPNFAVAQGFGGPAGTISPFGNVGGVPLPQTTKNFGTSKNEGPPSFLGLLGGLINS